MDAKKIGETVMETNIPFMIELKTGRCGVKMLWFKNKTKAIKYNYLCKTNDARIMSFRTAIDARMAAKGNDWTYIGRT